MSDISGRLRSVREQVAELARLARNGQPDAAEKLAGQLDEALERLLQELAARGSTFSDSKAKAPRAPRHEVIACPRCSLRSLHYEKGSIRPAAEEGEGFEALYRCRSCGHSVWQEV